VGVLDRISYEPAPEPDIVLWEYWTTRRYIRGDETIALKDSGASKPS
jgi:hypothetical protein